MQCIDCGEITKVTESTKQYKTVYRKRRGPSCGSEFYTTEKVMRRPYEVKLCKKAINMRYAKHKKKE